MPTSKNISHLLQLRETFESFNQKLEQLKRDFAELIRLNFYLQFHLRKILVQQTITNLL